MGQNQGCCLQGCPSLVWPQATSPEAKAGDRKDRPSKKNRPSGQLNNRWSARHIQRKAGKAGILGAGRWIYRLVCNEDVEKVYTLEQKLGAGGFATVYLAKHKEMGYLKAVKKIKKSEDPEEMEMLKNEIDTLMDLDHPHIMKLSRMYDNGQYLYIVSELCRGPSLLDRIMRGPMSELEAGAALRHILKAVLCCHAHYIGHYDIKPDNFVYAEEDCKSLKMIDLGLSRNFSCASDEFRGTVHYTAPDVFNGVYGPEADIWSCGVILYTMTTRKAMCPLTASEDKVRGWVQSRDWLNTKFDNAKDLGASSDALAMMREMLHTDRHLRITAAVALDHPYIQKTYETRNLSPEDRAEALAVMKSMVLRFTQFGQEPVLVRAVLLVMVHIAAYITKDTQVHRNTYSMLDGKGVGEISIESIEKMMTFNGVAIPENLEKSFKGVDIDLNGYISYGDFLAATLPRSLRCRQDLNERIFRLLDRNQDGFIDTDDMAATFIAEQDTVVNRDLCRQSLSEVLPQNRSLNPRLDLVDFKKMMLGGRSMISDSCNGFEALCQLDSSVNLLPPTGEE